MDSPGFFLLVGALLASAIAIACRPHEGLGLPVIAVMTFVFLYVAQPFFLAEQGQLDLFLSEAQTNKAFAWPALALVVFVGGWMAHEPRPSAGTRPWNAGDLWWFGFIGATAGLSLYCAFIARSGGFSEAFRIEHGRAAAWTENTAYLYLGPWWTLSGTAMMLYAAAHLPGSAVRWVVPGCFAVTMWANAILVSSRGYLFAATVVVFAATAIGRRWRISLRAAAPAGVALGLAVLAVLGFRSVLRLDYDGENLPDARSALTAAMAIDPVSAARRVTGNEFVVHAATIDTVDATHRYDYCLNWLYTYVVHPIPRVLWPDKPYRFDSPGVRPEDVYGQTGIVIAAGSAPGIVADLYSNLGWFSPAFFCAFGALSKRLYTRALQPDRPAAAMAYVMLLAVSLHCFAQGFGAILVFYPYSLAPLLAYALWNRRAEPAMIPCHPLP